MEESQKVKLSIVMPVFNGVELVIKMWQSIIANDFKDWELWAIDDGSTQDTFETLSNFAKTDERIHYIKRDRAPKGAQTCRNIGFEKADGEFIIFMDSDDYVAPECLRVRVQHLQNRPDIDFMVFPSGTVQSDKFNPEATLFAYGYNIYPDDVKAFASRTLPFVVWNNIYRTASLKEKHISWNENLLSLQDADFNLSSILSGLKYDYAKCPAYFGYRIDANSNSISKKIISKEHQQSHIYAINHFYQMIQQQYRHKYDYALYNGCLTIYNRVFEYAVDFEYANRIASSIYQYSHLYGAILYTQIALTKVLNHFVSGKRARQIPMLLFLLQSNRHKFHSKPKRIKKNFIR